MTATAYQTDTKDWHPADIKAALAKKSYTFARIAREHGYVENSPNMVLHKPWSQVEEIVAKIIGINASTIWPSRYDRRGRPLRSGKGRIAQKHNSCGKIAQKRTRLNV